MIINLIRHGMSEANQKRLYCGATDAPLCDEGRRGLYTLKQTVSYPIANIFITSGLLRTNETLMILYGRAADFIIEELREMNFGDFEMKSHDDLNDLPAYRQWINDIDNLACPGGESKSAFNVRVKAGFEQLLNLEAESATAVCHGGTIATVMEHVFPGRKNYYEWLPAYGRGYTFEYAAGRAECYRAI